MKNIIEIANTVETWCPADAPVHLNNSEADAWVAGAEKVADMVRQAARTESDRMNTRAAEVRSVIESLRSIKARMREARDTDGALDGFELTDIISDLALSIDNLDITRDRLEN